MTRFLKQFALTVTPSVRWAWASWAILLAIISIIILCGNEKTVTPAYRQGAASWLAGTDLYLYQGVGFVYLPQAAIAFVPFSLLPHTASEIAWRCFILAIFVAGLWRFAALASREAGRELFPLMTMVCLAMTWSSMRNGQSTIPMTGFMMLAAADLAGSRWWRSTLWLSLALIFKPLIVVFLLLALALHPPLRWRLLCGLAGVALFPFLFQKTGYVWEQYADCLEMLRLANAIGNQSYFAQIFGMLRVAGLEVPSTWQNVTRVVAAVGTLGICYLAKQRHSVAHAHLLLYALAGSYLMLFNPRTENNTYSHLAPALAAFAGMALVKQNGRAWGVYYLGCALVVLSSWEIGRLFTPPEHAVWLAPMGCLAFAIPVVIDACRRGSKLATGSQIAATDFAPSSCDSRLAIPGSSSAAAS